MRILLILAGVVLCTIVLLALMVCWLRAPRILEALEAQAQDCRPHIYLSGTVEIRGRPGVLYVLDYRDLQELGRMLQVVQADMSGRQPWMGTD